MKMLMKTILKSMLPIGARRFIRQAQKSVVYYFRLQRIKIAVRRGAPIKIIIGAAMTRQAGWYSTNEQWLDISSTRDWNRVFRGKSLLTHALAEHVFEHLSEDEIRRSLALLWQHMLPGGRIRIAVPDGYHPEPNYIRHVGIGGIGADAEDHKQLLNCDTLRRYLKDAGFVAEMLEGYCSDGVLVQMQVLPSEGLIMRSRSNAETMAGRAGWDFVDANTSLIVDGIRPS